MVTCRNSSVYWMLMVATGMAQNPAGDPNQVICNNALLFGSHAKLETPRR